MGNLKGKIEVVTGAQPKHYKINHMDLLKQRQIVRTR